MRADVKIDEVGDAAAQDAIEHVASGAGLVILELLRDWRHPSGEQA